VLVPEESERLGGELLSRGVEGKEGATDESASAKGGTKAEEEEEEDEEDEEEEEEEWVGSIWNPGGMK
jgi:hypothetical protein